MSQIPILGSPVVLSTLFHHVGFYILQQTNDPLLGFHRNVRTSCMYVEISKPTLLLISWIMKCPVLMSGLKFDWLSPWGADGIHGRGPLALSPGFLFISSVREVVLLWISSHSDVLCHPNCPRRDSWIVPRLCELLIVVNTDELFLKDLADRNQ